MESIGSVISETEHSAECQFVNRVLILEVVMIREITRNDFDGLMRLYMQLHENPMPEKTPNIIELWNRIIDDKDHHIIVAEVDGKIVSSCVCVIIPNLTHNQQPYAFVENVITDEEYRKKGLATECLKYAKEIALKENCYKLMLLTGSKKESTLWFYEQAGYNRNDKTAFIQWI
jgi:GNAT superfamily N-acetyltransferase